MQQCLGLNPTKSKTKWTATALMPTECCLNLQHRILQPAANRSPNISQYDYINSCI